MINLPSELVVDNQDHYLQKGNLDLYIVKPDRYQRIYFQLSSPKFHPELRFHNRKHNIPQIQINFRSF